MTALADLDNERLKIETQISAVIADVADTTNEGRAVRAERLHLLHENLATVFEEIERMAWHDPALGSLAGTLRWAVTGACRTAEYWSDAAIAWRAPR